MLQYYAKEFFAPIIVSPELSADGTKISIYIVVDGTPDTKKADLTLNIYNWSSADWNPVKVYTNNQTKLEENKSFIAYQVTVADALSGSGRKEDFFLTTTLEVANKPIAPENFLFFTYVRYSGYPETSVKISGITLVDNQTAEITLVADRFALFVWLDLNELKGTFSKNGFHMLKPTTKVTFRSKFPVDLRALQKITVTWLKKNYS
uniref:Unkown protein n=1 Tax=Riptortus pedestris TaxID=329032 RepID=R4WSE3_RIPPE|nr:unkown protein [Riptortus pedestris]